MSPTILMYLPAIGLFASAWYLENHIGGKQSGPAKILWPVFPIAVLLASVCFVVTDLGQLLTDASGNFLPTGLLALFAGIALMGAVADIWKDRWMDNGARTCLLFLPPLVHAAGGLLAVLTTYWDWIVHGASQVAFVFSG